MENILARTFHVTVIGRSHYSLSVEVLRSINELRQMTREARRSGKRIALVPTMGALHEGHASLLRAAQDPNTAVIVSIYVNPTQFGPGEDFKNYPRDFAADQQLCAREGASAVFAPTDEQMYTGEASTWVD